jgi:HK97 family phage portal protein
VIVRASDGTKRELFAGFDSSVPIPRPSQQGTTWSTSGERIDLQAAVGLPAFLRGLRLIGESSAGLPVCLYRGYGERRREVPGASQLSLLRRPNPEQTRFGFWQYLFGCLPLGNAYIYKVKVRRQVRALYPVNPKFVIPDYSGSEPVFALKDREYGPVVREVGRGEIIHIPGLLLEDPYVGVSVVALERNPLGVELARQRFEARHIANDAKPGVVLSHPGNVLEEQRNQLREGFETRHQNQPGRPALMWGGWTIDTLPVSMEDTQFIESKQFSVREVANMLGVPAGMLGDPEAPSGDSPEQENMRFLQYGLKPWMERLEDALEEDEDLFPEPDWSVEFDEAGFLRADIKTRYEAYRLARQGGWKSPNEIRADEGLEPKPGADDIQETPVGGAPNTGGSSTDDTD